MSDLFALDPSVNITVKKPYEIKVQLTNKDCMPNYSSEEAAGLDLTKTRQTKYHTQKGRTS